MGSSSDHDSISLSASSDSVSDNKPLSLGVNGRGSVQDEDSTNGEHQVAGSGVWMLCKKPRLAKSQADRRAGRKEMCGGISLRFLRRIT